MSVRLQSLYKDFYKMGIYKNDLDGLLYYHSDLGINP